MEREPCLTWEKAKFVGEDRGLKLSEKCPLEGVCNGSSCMMADRRTVAGQQLEKFYDKLQKHKELIVK